MTSRTDRKISLGFSGGLVLFAISALLTIGAMERVVSDTRWVTHSYEVRRELRSLYLNYVEAKSHVRSFVLTGDSTYVMRYRAAVDSAHLVADSIAVLTRDNADQRARLSALRPLLVERDESLAKLVALGSINLRGPSADTLRAALLNGERLSRALGDDIAAMSTIEQGLLSAREAAQLRSEAQVRWLLVVLALLGSGIAWMMRRSVGRDLLLRTRAEAALRESEARFAGIISLAGDAIVTIDESQRIRLFNRGAEQVFGFREEDVLGKRIEILLPEDIAPSHREHVLRFASSPESARRMGERRGISGRRRNGELFPAEASISKLETPDGRLFTVVLRDVTEQRRVARYEHLLAETGRALADTLDYDAILTTVAKLPVPDIGDWALVDVVEEGEAGRRTFRRVVSRHPDARVDAALRQIEAWQLNENSPSRVLDVIRTGAPELVQVDDEWLEAHSDAEVFPAAKTAGARSLVIVPLTVAHRVLGTITIARRAGRPRMDANDLALGAELAARAALAIENARNFRKAQEASRARDEVLNVVSHDLRNPLAALAMCARTLLEHPDTGLAERNKLYHNALEAVDWMHRLVQDLLDSASIDAGRLSIEIEPQSVPGLVDTVIDMFEQRAETQGVALTMEVDPAMPLVNADPARILQVLSNLVSNAIKYTPKGGCVSVGAEVHGDEVHFRVRDTGAGIAPEHIPRLFDRFWTLRGASRTPGTGLGLPIAKGIVTAHGGRVWVESTVGRGSTFWFSLPLAPRPITLPPRPIVAARVEEIHAN